MWYEFVVLGACLVASVQAVLSANRAEDQKRSGLIYLWLAIAAVFMAGAMWQLSIIIN